MSTVDCSQDKDGCFRRAIESCRDTFPPIKTGVVHPVRVEDIEVVAEAVAQKLIDPVLIGPKARIEAAALAAKIDISKWSLVDVEHSHAGAAKGAEMAAKGARINRKPNVDAFRKSVEPVYGKAREKYGADVDAVLSDAAAIRKAVK